MLKMGATFNVGGRQVQVLVLLIPGPAPRMVILFGRDGVAETMFMVTREPPQVEGGVVIEALT